MTAKANGNDLLCQLMPLGTIRTLSTSGETPLSSDLDYYQILEAKVLLQVCVSIYLYWVNRIRLKNISNNAGQADANAL